MKKFTAIILAGGKGKRFGSSIPKPFMSLNGKAVIQYSIDIFEPLVDEIILVSNKQYKDYKCVKGGEFRSHSVENGLKASSGDFVIVHDGARPFVRKETVIAMKEMLISGYDCVDTVSPIIDGYVEGDISITKADKKLGLTPEGFRRDLLVDTFSRTKDRTWQDEITMVQSIQEEVKCGFVQGQSFNSKITYEDDLAYAEGIMKFWSRAITTKPNLDRKVLVFGGSGGIGQACIKQLKNYVAPSHKEVDLSSDWNIDLKGFDSVIYSAGEYKDISKIMQVNFLSCVKLVELAEQQGWKGNIVFLSSTAATYGRKGIGMYCASKSALNAYIESRAEELAEKGIYINAIAPAKVDTPLQKAINPKTPKEDMMTPDYVADFILRYTDTTQFGDVIYLRKGFDI